jgi:pilus assembly protein Flp/PilA
LEESEMNMLKRLWKEEEGQAMTEYGLIIGLIAIVVIAAVTLIGTKLDGVFDEIASKLVTKG